MTTIKSDLDILVSARQLISDPTRWTQGSNGKDSDGREVASWDETATSWCLLGAIRRQVIGDTSGVISPAYWESYHRVIVAVEANSPTTAGTLIHEFNDTSDHATVLAVLDRTIDSLRDA